ncbi:MAG: hypothetical protein B7Z38_01800 [Rhodobacterales bacterium 12-64-8]|nr:MAG: hypothetical protein B7Z38_01800 [Rhodobacterales bacterium 12-64-8]OYX47938.1 MAG: hypothetical protein B7Y90_12095 [Alphaproteobacteria bacterium 32-64-14]
MTAESAKRKYSVWYVAAWVIGAVVSAIAMGSCVMGGPVWLTVASLGVSVVSALSIIRMDVKAAANAAKAPESGQT